jgi:hypothetical protein
LVARTHQTLIWDRTRQVLRLRSVLRQFFPAALSAFDDLAAPDTLELLGRAPDPDRAAGLSRAQIAAALRRARRRHVDAKASTVQDTLAYRTAAPTRCGTGRLRGDRDHPGAADRHAEHRNRATGRGGGSAFWPAPGR